MSDPADRGTVIEFAAGASDIAVARGMESSCWPAPVEGEDDVILGFAHPVFGWIYFAFDPDSATQLAADIAAFALPAAPTTPTTPGA